MKKNEAQAAEFEARLEDSRRHTAQYLTQQHTRQASLPMQSNLAALQGVEGKAKQARATYRMEAEDWRKRLMVLARDSPGLLVRGNENLVLNAHASTFEKGGDYNDEEITLLKELMDNTSAKLHITVKERIEVVEELKKEQESALALAARFKERYDRCLQDLCMRDGLGQKYGAPRRNPQERLRTEVARSDMASEKIDKLLVLLKTLCASAEQGENSSDGVTARKKRNRSFWSLRIRRCLIELRNAIYRRAQYLAFLKRHPNNEVDGDDNAEMRGVLVLDDASCLMSVPEDLEVQGCTYDVMFDDGGRDKSVAADCIRMLVDEAAADETAEEATELKAGTRIEAKRSGGVDFLPGKVRRVNSDGDKGDPKDEVLSASTFLQVVSSLEEKCKEDTRALYAAEGKEDELGPGGVPEALQLYLDEQRERAAMHEEAASRKLREQTAELQDLLVKAPAAALTDMVRRARERAAKTREGREAVFAEVAMDLDRKKQVNKGLLKPQLSDPNKLQELEALCEAEAGRTADAQKVIAEVKRDLLDKEEDHAKDLERRFLAIIKAFGVILDSTPRVTDLGWLPGDDDIVPKRKCLKRLRLQQRKKKKLAAAGEDGAETEADASPPRFEVRSWKPIPEFGNLTVGAVEKESARLESERRTASGEEGVDGDADAGVVEGVDEIETEGGDAAAPQDGSLTTLVTTAHRQFVKARDIKYNEYRTYFFTRMMQTAEEYDALLTQEHAWAGNWSTMVEYLKKDEDADSDDDSTA
jgi:hypothetical protein